MPTLLFLAPCEKVVIDQNNASSIIAILEEIQIQIIAGAQIPPGAVAPMQWAVLALWEQSSAWENGRTFEQRTALLSATGEHLLESIGTFTFDKPRQRMINQILGMPISNPGAHKVKVWIREKSDSPKEWKEMGSISIIIGLKPPPPSNGSPPN